METHYGNIPDIAVLSIIERDMRLPEDPYVYVWTMEITPDHRHKLMQGITGSGKWRVSTRISAHAIISEEDRYMFAIYEAEKAWVEYWNPEKYIKNGEAVNDNFILDGAL